MKNLKENAMMQEMNLQEMKEVNGGNPLGYLIDFLVTYYELSTEYYLPHCQKNPDMSEVSMNCM